MNEDSNAFLIVLFEEKAKKNNRTSVRLADEKCRGEVHSAQNKDRLRDRHKNELEFFFCRQ